MDNLVALSSLVAGGLLALQAGANATLARSLGSPLAASTVQLAVGLILLLVAALATGDLAALGRLGAVAWWHAVGGVASALYVTTAILVFPRLGAVVSVGLFIAGQMLTSLLLDGFGWLGVPLRPPGAGALGGTLAVLAGAAAIVVGQKGGDRVAARVGARGSFRLAAAAAPRAVAAAAGRRGAAPRRRGVDEGGVGRAMMAA